MKVFHTAVFAIILALSNDDVNPIIHGLHREEDHDRHGGQPFTQDMHKMECDVSIFCDDIDEDTLDCDIKSRPEHPDFTGMTDEEK